MARERDEYETEWFKDPGLPIYKLCRLCGAEASAKKWPTCKPCLERYGAGKCCICGAGANGVVCVPCARSLDSVQPLKGIKTKGRRPQESPKYKDPNYRRNWYKERMDKMSPEEYEAYKEKNRIYQKEWKERMTPEQREALKEKERIYSRRQRGIYT